MRFYIKIGLFFYMNKTRVVGKENVPKKGAVLFAVNHPNGLLDPLLVTCNNPRASHFLVKAAAFTNPIYKKILNALNLIAIYRIRDGIQQLSKNEEVFNQCFEILKNKQSLMIFPEGSDNMDRTVRTLSKGFTRIVFGALEKYPDLEINVVPVGITYQNVAAFPSKAAIHFGKPIHANTIYNNHIPSKSIRMLKDIVSESLKKLSVHIEKDELYKEKLRRLNLAQVDFSNIHSIQAFLDKNVFPPKKSVPINYVKPLFYLVILNSIIPYLIYKKYANRNSERDFIDTFRFAFNIFSFPFFYGVQALLVAHFFGIAFGGLYLWCSLLSVFLYTKLSPTATESHLE